MGGNKILYSYFVKILAVNMALYMSRYMSEVNGELDKAKFSPWPLTFFNDMSVWHFKERRWETEGKQRSCALAVFIRSKSFAVRVRQQFIKKKNLVH